jgi:tRNA-Thr(GGU) m(6)t(6)A37 methyltransferase TsaA
MAVGASCDSVSGAFDPVVLHPIGVVRSPFARVEGMPLQSVAAREVEARIEFSPELAPGLRDLDGFSHLHLLAWLDRAPTDRGLEIVPFLDSVRRGVFATRSPARPNPLGLSVVRLLAVVGDTVHVPGIDLLDFTPVLDVKPYVPTFDRVEDPVRTGWLETRAAEVERVGSDDRLSGD